MDKISLPPELKLSGEEPLRISITLDAKTSELLQLKFTEEAKFTTIGILESIISDFVNDCSAKGRRREKILDEDALDTKAVFRFQKPSRWARFSAIMGATLFGAGLSALLIVLLGNELAPPYLIVSCILLAVGAFLIGAEVFRR